MSSRIGITEITKKIVFILALTFCFTSFASPPIALAIGIILALTLGNPFAKQSTKVTKFLLQASVVGLGFGMNLGKVIEAGKSGFMITAVSITFTLLLGYIIGRWLKINRNSSHLISSGTAICGGSAIAAVGPVLNADDKEMSVALGTVFVLNAIALFIFPVIGHLLKLSQTQFGIWAAIAIHDTSSVVGAAAKYGEKSLEIATVVKLTRALWIIPVTVLTAFIFKNKGKKITIPYFIFLFVLASVLRTYIHPVAEISGPLVNAAKIGLTITLFLIGAGLSRETLKTVGVKPLLQGVILWIIIASASLWAIVKIM
ncbi:MAG: putative sulfate exporter family transporter [Ignavibacteriaceae bacterium]